MCGLAGFLSRGYIHESVCHEMLDQIIHRGPDDSGVWVNDDTGIALGHRRLSIQDLSPLGHQPMESQSGRYITVFNGEIYNFKLLQDSLTKLGCVFRGHSDTEVLLAAIEAWGIEDALKSFVGMFAFVVWDKEARVLTLARDRLGEKPLYYGWQKNTFLFGSELKALKAHPDWVGEINRDSLALYMRHNCIPAPYSIYKEIFKLNPGTFMQIAVDEMQPAMVLPIPVVYWQAKAVAENGVNHPLGLPDDEAIESLDMLLRETIREKMISDVPLGAFLSGGIDSSAVVALMQQESTKPVKTFSIGFHEQGYNEAEHAKEVAMHLGTEHTEMYVTSEQAMDVIPKLPSLYDEPFSDSSQIPTFLVSEMTKQHVTVALSGDGGDELFAGYNRYFLGQSIWNKLSKFPYGLRSLLSTGITNISPNSWDKFGRVAGPIIPSIRNKAGDKLHKLADILSVQSSAEMYSRLVSHWKEPSDVVLSSKEPATVLTDVHCWAELDSFTQEMMFLDTISYLPDDILVKVDRASMSVSLETRVPFLDHRVVEFAWRVPMAQKIRDGQGKWILRQLLYRYVPKKVIERPKMGFGVPIGDWLRGSLRDWAEALLNEERLKREGFFDTELVRQKWKEHLSGRKNWQYCLWDVLMFQAWLEHELDS